MTDYSPATALVVVDVQNDFADPAGSLAVPGGEQVVEAANAHIAAAVAAGATIVYTQDWHPESTPHFVTGGGPWPPHCVRDTWGAQLHPDLLLRGEVVRKGVHGEDGYSGFTVRDDATGESTQTPLADLLRAAGVVELVVLGLATDYCVKATALDARTLGWPVTVPWESVRAVDVRDGDEVRAREALERAGVRIS